MKFIKVVLAQRPDMKEQVVRDFIYSNFPRELIVGLEYDDPKAVNRALRLVGLQPVSQLLDSDDPAANVA